MVSKVLPRSTLSPEESTGNFNKTCSNQQQQKRQPSSGDDCAKKTDKKIDAKKEEKIISSFLWKNNAHQRFGFQLCQGSDASGIYISNISANSQLRNSDLKASYRNDLLRFQYFLY